MEVDPGPERKHGRPTASHLAAVARAEAHFRAHMDAPVPVSRLSRTVGLSERGLRNAFYRVRGMSPKQWMLAERLQGVRHVLTDECPGGVTVTRVATDFGFFELGRFAATYRKAFGEAPFETLRALRLKACTRQTTTHERVP